MKQSSLAMFIAALSVVFVSAQERQAGAGAGQNPAGQGQGQGGRRGGGGGPGGGQTPTDRPFRVVKTDPALDAIIAADARADLLGDRFGLNEGPVWVQDGATGYLLFSDMLDNVIYKWEEKKPISVFLENAGYTGRDINNVGQQTRRGRSAVILIGPNGLTLDPQGRVIICAMPDRTIVRLEKDGMRTILADKFEGKRFNGPNDVVGKSDGAIYFTDSVSGIRGGNQGQRELLFNGFYLVKDGKVTLLDEKLRDPSAAGSFPNGIALSADEKKLYVTLGRKIMRYDINADDTISNPQEFADVQGNDGLKVDKAGNVYTTNGAGAGEVRIFAPDGKRLGTLEMPQRGGEPRSQVCATNVAFGDADSRSLFVTACTDLYRIRLKVPGVRPGPQ
jgi:gluconolactonase